MLNNDVAYLSVNGPHHSLFKSIQASLDSNTEDEIKLLVLYFK